MSPAPSLIRAGGGDGTGVASSLTAAAEAVKRFDAAAVAVGRTAGNSSGSTPRAGVGTRGLDLTGLGGVPLSVSATSTPRKIGASGVDAGSSPSGSSTPRRQPGSHGGALRKGVSIIHRDEPMARRQAGEATTAVDEVPASASTPPLGGWQYICPVYGHSAVGFGAATAVARPSSSLQTDVDECLFTVALPPGRRSSEHWVARNVALLVCADPGQLLNALQC